MQIAKQAKDCPYYPYCLKNLRKRGAQEGETDCCRKTSASEERKEWGKWALRSLGISH